ncbi:MAG TPA: NAD-dependent epimerase/dehydratase family protein [Gemmataceae bacterium]|nr:NAD-dependent epimerase/dehydratase family protein [Gemmataceae bacterium]
MRCLITGATGFVGRHLIAALRAAGHEVVGLARESADLDILVHTLDLNDTPATTTLLKQIQPAWIFHLAGYADNGRSFQEPAAAWAGNRDATRSLYTAMVQAELRPRILYVSSGLVYGDAGPGEHVFTETDALRPASPYAESKVAAEQLSREFPLDIVYVRPFNQIGPGQLPNYAVANFARQVVAVERELQTHVIVKGNLNARRDLTDVRDMVKAYIRLLEVGQSGEVYNAGSGQTYRMGDILNRLAALAHITLQIDDQSDPNRQADTAVSRADIRKLQQTTGWKPEHSVEQTLTDVLADCRG